MSNSDFFGEMRQYERENNIQETAQTLMLSAYDRRTIAATDARLQALSVERAKELRENDAAFRSFTYLEKIANNATERARIQAQMRSERDPYTYATLVAYKKQLDRSWKNMQREYAAFFNA